MSEQNLIDRAAAAHGELVTTGEALSRELGAMAAASADAARALHRLRDRALAALAAAQTLGLPHVVHLAKSTAALCNAAPMFTGVGDALAEVSAAATFDQIIAARAEAKR